MQAAAGDRIVIKGHHIGDRDRSCEMIEAHGPEGVLRIVRWGDSEHETLFFPGSDAAIESREHATS